MERPGDIKKYAYINGGTLWLGNWVKNNNAQQGKYKDINIDNNMCKNKLGCACDGTKNYDGDYRLVKPSIGDCSKPGIRYKRSWKEHLCWSNTDIYMGSRGSMPRTTLTGKRRVVVDTRNNDNDKKIKYSSSQGVNLGIKNVSKFKNLRNRRGVKRDKLLQTRLDLSMVFSGDSNSPLSQGHDKSGKRKASVRGQ